MTLIPVSIPTTMPIASDPIRIHVSTCGKSEVAAAPMLVAVPSSPVPTDVVWCVCIGPKKGGRFEVSRPFATNPNF